MLTLDIQQSTVKTRLAKAKQLIEGEKEGRNIDIEALGIIDPDSLQRLGLFSQLQANAGRSAEFLASQPQRLEEAKTQYSSLLALMAKEQRLKADFGEGHPEVRNLQNEIALVKSFVADNKDAIGDLPLETELTPSLLMKTYQIAGE